KLTVRLGMGGGEADHLHRHVSVEAQIPAAVYCTHPAATDHLVDAVAADQSAPGEQAFDSVHRGTGAGSPVAVRNADHVPPRQANGGCFPSYIRKMRPEDSPGQSAPISPRRKGRAGLLDRGDGRPLPRAAAAVGPAPRGEPRSRTSTEPRPSTLPNPASDRRSADRSAVRRESHGSG